MFNPPYPREQRDDVLRLMDELIKIGQVEDYLSEHPGGAFTGQCRHRRAREIGTRLNDIGGYPLMELAYERVRKKLGRNLADHLEYAWAEIGEWMR
ncbi:MAG: hypothetical protein HPY85_11040 [Anaerolineae bacterium]|nr:hypothetical protein [Anaerolineae bacterium]